MHKYKFVGNSDYDELFYPARIAEENLTTLLDRIDRDSIGSFIFRARYHQLLHDDSPNWDTFVDDDVIDRVTREYLPLHHFVNVSTMVK